MAFYPPDREVPQARHTDRLALRPLRTTDVELDYDAVMSSAEMLRRWSQSEWPADDFTLSGNLRDLEWHELEHDEREAFTYTVLDPQGTRCLGCVYITPLRRAMIALGEGAAYPANVGFWVRASEVPGGLDAHLLTTLRAWLDEAWAFDRVVYRVGTQDDHHASLFEAEGLSLVLTFTSSDGQRWRVFG